MIKYICLFLLLTQAAQTQEFQSAKDQAKKIACSESKSQIVFSDIQKPYSLYDKNSTSIKIFSCEKIQLKEYIFYSIVFSSEIREGTEPQQVLTYEVALYDKKSNNLKTVRSETIDQIDTSGDQAESKFETRFKSEWGLAKKDGQILLKINAHAKNEKPEPYLLKFNTKSQWFENHFEKTPAKK